ncbi:hypothetical protein [Georgenia sp. AZ-5]|uniref:hypothetical protein n=1 Tax=Georgenia sp. AZ-5 TaxID=3367526 RepID=UPI0037542E3B
MEIQGYVVMALTLLLLGYLLPTLVRNRQLLLDSRVGDRFSGDLRILATTGPGRTARTDGTHHGPQATRPYLHDPARRPEAPVNRPHARTESAAEDARALAAARAARAARVARRAAAVRRHRALTVLLLLAAVAGWAAFALASTPWPLGAAPTLLLVVVLDLGRRTAAKARAHDRRDRAEMARLEARLRALPRRGEETPPAPSRLAGTRTRGALPPAAARPAGLSGARPAGATAAPATPRPAAHDTGAAATDAPDTGDAATDDAPVGSAAQGDDGGATPREPRPEGAPADRTPAADRTHVTGRAPGADRATAGSGAVPASDPERATGNSARAAGRSSAPAGTHAPDAEPAPGRARSAAPPDRAAAAPATDHGDPAPDVRRVVASPLAPALDRRAYEAPAGAAWTPMPVPVPSYTLKPALPRRDVDPYTDEVATPSAAVPQRPTAASPATAAAVLAEPVAVTLDLDAVLARRRAAGE